MTLINLQNLFPILTQTIFCGWAMMQKLRINGFKWMNDEELEKWGDLPCIIEVDLKYSKNLHTLHNDYPLAPENIKPSNSKADKLTPNLNNKMKYIVHYKTLQLYEKLGLKVTKVHRGIKFYESPWLKPYIYIFKH